MKFLFVVNDAWFFLSHRSQIAGALLDRGHEVHLVARADKSVRSITDMGVIFHEWEIDPRSTNPVKELWALMSLWRIQKRVAADLVHLVTIKSIIYGGFGSALVRTGSVIFAFSGLGSMIHGSADGSNARRTLILGLYRLIFRLNKNRRVVFQNIGNLDFVLSAFPSLAGSERLIRGSGVDLQAFRYTVEPIGRKKIVLAARLLKDKGISEFVMAANLLVAKGRNYLFEVAGDRSGEGNPAAYTEEELAQLQGFGSVAFLGHCDDIPRLYNEAHIVVLPSYHEGLPKSLVEAAACGRAVITTDVPGCRDAILPNVSGLLVPVRDAQSLADTIEYLAVNDDVRREMGRQGRMLAEQEFDVNRVVDQHLEIYSELTGVSV